MRISVIKFGEGRRDIDLQPGTTVNEALSQLGMSLGTNSVMVNGRNSSPNTPLTDGDQVQMVANVKGG